MSVYTFWLHNSCFVFPVNTISAGQLLCGGLFSADSLSNWFASVALLHAVLGNTNNREQLLRVQLATSLGNPPVSLLQQCCNMLAQVRTLVWIQSKEQKLMHLKTKKKNALIFWIKFWTSFRIPVKFRLSMAACRLYGTQLFCGKSLVSKELLWENAW